MAWNIAIERGGAVVRMRSNAVNKMNPGSRWLSCSGDTETVMGDVDDANRSGDAPNAELGALDTELGTTRHLLGSHESSQASELKVREPEVTQSGVTPHRLPSKPPSSMIGNGRFQLGELLGSGGMGLVYSAFDRELSRSVAIKFLHQSHKLTGTVQLELLRGEARAVARLNHPNIVHVYDLGVADGQPYLVMELVTGEQLQAILDRGPLSFGEAMQIADQLLDGLEHAHAAGIVHRDLKPSNVLRVRGGRIAILDFGLAGLDDDDSHIAGTPPYMAPEQWMGQRPDVRSDLWSLAVLLFEMLVGSRPFRAGSLERLRDAILNANPFAHGPTEDPRLPAHIARVLARALEKAPDRRFQSATHFRAALREATTGSSAAPPLILVPEQRQVTVLACTIDFDAFVLDTDLPPGLVENLEDGGSKHLQRWQVECTRLVREHDGLVISQVSGQLVVCFGYPTVSGGAPLLALQAAAAIRALSVDLARQAAIGLAVRVGVATGLVIVEEPRDSHDRGVPVIQGSPVQAATTLVRLANSGEVLVSSRTHELVRGWFESEPVVRSGAPQAFRLGEPLDVALRFDIAARRELTPLHGRDHELRILAEAWRIATAGEGTCLTLVGEAGVGKSRLAHELKQAVTAENGVVMTAQCWPQRRRTPFHPLVSLLRRSLGLYEASDASTQRRIMAETLAGFSPAVRDDVTLFAVLLSLDEAPLTGQPEQVRARTIDSLSTLLFEMAATGPLLLVIEDVHWSDPSTIEWLDRIIPRLDKHRLLIVLTARPEIGARWKAEPHHREHRLEALSEADARVLAEGLAGHVGAMSRDSLLDEIVQRAGGIPLYLEELVRFVVVTEARTHTLRRQIPATLRDTLVAGLDRLSAEARLVAQIGAVLEHEFRPYLISGMVQDHMVDVHRGLHELEDAGVITGRPQRHGRRFFFRHALLQEAAYQSLVPAQRRAYHSRAADLLLAARSQGADVPAELLASHYDAAGRVPEALDQWEEAGIAAARKWALREAIDQLSRALALLATMPAGAARDKRELSLLLTLGPPLMSVMGYAAADVSKAYTRAYELALHADGSANELFSPLVGLWQVNTVAGNLPAARRLSERLLELANSAANPVQLMIARRTFTTALFFQGEIAAAIEQARMGIALYDRSVHGPLAFQHGNDLGMILCIYRAWGLWIHGAPREARAFATQARELADAISHPVSVAFSNSYSAIIENLCGDFKRAEELALHGLEVSRTHRLAMWAALAELQIGWALAGQGRLSDAIASMQRALASWANTGSRTGTTMFYAVLADTQIRAGELGDAAASLATGEAMVAKNGERFFEPELTRIGVRLAHLRSEPLVELIQRLRGALDQAAQQSAGSWTLRLVSDLVELTRETELAADATALLARALTAIEGGEGTMDVLRARTLAKIATDP